MKKENLQVEILENQVCIMEALFAALDGLNRILPSFSPHTSLYSLMARTNRTEKLLKIKVKK